MKNPSPRKIALLAALVPSVITIALTFLVCRFLLSGQWWLLAAGPLCVYVSAYWTFFYFLENFIYSKVKLIYKTIYRLKAPKDGPSQSRVNMDSDIISEVSQQVLDWANYNKNEIEQLKKLETFRREFLGNVSHELKTPLFSIQGYLYTLLDNDIDEDAIKQLYLEKAAKNVERLCTIVADLESISKLESGELEVEARIFDIHDLFKEVIDALELNAKEKNIRLEFEEGSDKPFYVEADKERIRQVVTNLLVNSMKYGKEGGKTVIGIYDMFENALIEVTDNGIGIEEKHLNRVFERFFRVEGKSRSRDAGGTGLGLAIVKHIIEAHRQTINVRSTIGEGSTFGFTLKKA